VHIEVLSNQASKQPRTINNALKMQRILFIRFMTSRIKLIIIHADKDECSKRDKFSLIQNLELFSQALHFETKGHLMMYFIEDLIAKHKSK
jgi:hypothetical protein